MKKTILFLLVALLNFATMSAQEVKKTIYVIDGKKVENFDGSQLKGKTIVNYTIDSEHNIHAIFTSDYNTNGRKIGNVKIISNSIKEEVKESEPGKSTSESIHVDSTDEVVFVLNGNVVPYSSVKEVPSSKIVSMNVIKNKKDPDYIKYAKNAKLPPKCIIVVTTK